MMDTQAERAMNDKIYSMDEKLTELKIEMVSVRMVGEEANAISTQLSDRLRSIEGKAFGNNLSSILKDWRAIVPILLIILYFLNSLIPSDSGSDRNSATAITDMISQMAAIEKLMGSLGGSNGRSIPSSEYNGARPEESQDDTRP